MSIRIAHPDDLDAISTLYSTLFSEMAALQPESCRPAGQERHFLEVALSSHDTEILVAEEAGNVVGFALVQEQETPDFLCLVFHRFAYLLDLCIHPDYRGQGLGAQLLREVKDWAHERRLDYVELNVLSQNKGAIRFYEREGYAPTMQRMQLPLGYA